jgi:DNA-binding CsgD family transcriptional regulator
VLIVTRDITVQKQAETRNQARLELLQRLRQARDIDECLTIGCQAIYNAQLFKRAVLTLHNEQRAITNLGQIGLEEAIVVQARRGSAPDLGLVKKMMQQHFKIGRSFFVPIESGIISKTMDRYIPQKEQRPAGPSIWHVGDELFVPVMGNDNSYEGWLSVDTPFNGLRPTPETVTYLEELVDITSTQVHEIRTIELLKKESKALEDKNVTLRVVLTHIDEEKMEIRQRIGNNISQILIPAFNKLVRKDGTINKTYYNILKEGLPELVTASGAVVSMYYRLSPREREICHMIKSGSTSKEIAATLNISLATVQKHRELIRRKLGLINKDINLVNYLKGV